MKSNAIFQSLRLAVIAFCGVSGELASTFEFSTLRIGTGKKKLLSRLLGDSFVLTLLLNPVYLHTVIYRSGVLLKHCCYSTLPLLESSLTFFFNYFNPQEHERVWYELALLRKIYLQTHSARKMVCIALPNTNINQQELPLWAELIYKWPEDEQKIFKRLNDRPIIQPW